MEELTIKAAAEYYGKSEYWIRKRILSGELEAEKRPFQYDQRWITTEKALDQLAADLKEQAKIEKDSINIREVSKPVDKKEFISELIEATESRNKALVDEAVIDINKKFEQQNELIMELKQEIEQQRKE
jgi:hypothetical protein